MPWALLSLELAWLVTVKSALASFKCLSFGPRPFECSWRGIFINQTKMMILLALLLGDKTMAQPRDLWREGEDLGSIPLSVVGKLPNTAPWYQMNQAIYCQFIVNLFDLKTHLPSSLPVPRSSIFSPLHHLLVFNCVYSSRQSLCRAITLATWIRRELLAGRLSISTGLTHNANLN